MTYLFHEQLTYLTDSGLETTLLFLDGHELPSFAAFPLYDNAQGRDRLERYYAEHLGVARDHGMGFVVEAATWRANAEWGATVGYGAEALDRVNRFAIAFGRKVAEQYPTVPTVVSGQIGPRGDGYVAGDAMTPAEAEAYHAPQVESFAAAGADIVAALTMTSSAEAIGIVRAARKAGIPAAIAFTVETDGVLPSGEALAEAIARTDRETDAGAAYFMINCAHPAHFEHVLGPEVAARVRGIRANASTCSHAELDAATALDFGDPVALGAAYRALGEKLPHLKVVGGCCGTDIRHIREIAARVTA
ncbi:homocysteine S-methyltransferase family protein [Acuticoccus sp. MNP-M23]|uniref:homocysteine S-methyltransferase family protein n=1 Tax=Acuticoccus sp. MNP-M23 TaxID=3072793 RepID=UPI0028168EF5|nr:homocysteine S-methyltransferase family protein [Acuticoccus sp. MNP-M23]WMS44383.1 homocysteine S-methyltransferase family protein [Acuticoccus sp. MNP-M23]